MVICIARVISFSLFRILKIFSVYKPSLHSTNRRSSELILAGAQSLHLPELISERLNLFIAKRGTKNFPQTSELQLPPNLNSIVRAFKIGVLEN